MEQIQPKYKRILLKLSGEALAAGAKQGEILNYEFVHEICREIKYCVQQGVQVSVIVGAGNIWRGRQGKDMDRVRADHMGMLATCINALALQDSLISIGLDARVLTAVPMHAFAEAYTKDTAVRYLNEGKVVIFGAGIGTPFFSTDTAAMMRAAEVGADVVMMAKNIDGVYTADPRKNPEAKKLDEIDYMYLLSHELTIIDSTAASFGKDVKLPCLIFGLDRAENIRRVISGENLGTVIS